MGALIVGKAAADASESADIRMGRFFPGKAYVGAVDLVPGTYTITVNFGGSVKEFKDVNVRAGWINLIKAVSLQYEFVRTIVFLPATLLPLNYTVVNYFEGDCIL
jgi:hypothetical protein